jgi:hypothetical protein
MNTMSIVSLILKNNYVIPLSFVPVFLASVQGIHPHEHDIVF